VTLFVCLFAGSKYLSSINDIDKSEHKSSSDATGKGISYDWTQKSGDCKYRTFANSVPHHIVFAAIYFPLYKFATSVAHHIFYCAVYLCAYYVMV